MTGEDHRQLTHRCDNCGEEIEGDVLLGPNQTYCRECVIAGQVPMPDKVIEGEEVRSQMRDELDVVVERHERLPDHILVETLLNYADDIAARRKVEWFLTADGPKAQPMLNGATHAETLSAFDMRHYDEGVTREELVYTHLDFGANMAEEFGVNYEIDGGEVSVDGV
jgi:hypothetical protein